MIQLLSDSVWRRITDAAKEAKTPAHVAVAYFSAGASNLLPLPPGSRLVVDASKGALRAGQTCPDDLLILQKAGVSIFSNDRLHAKIYIFDGIAFIGSANASTSAAEYLVEAVLETDDPKIIANGRRLVETWSQLPLGPELLELMRLEYRPPKRPKRKGSTDDEQALAPPIHLVQLDEPFDVPEEEEQADEERTIELEEDISAEFYVKTFHVIGRYAKDCTPVMFVDCSTEEVLVYPPGSVVGRRVWKGSPLITSVYVECRFTDPVPLEQLMAVFSRSLRRDLLEGESIDDPVLRAALWNYFNNLPLLEIDDDLEDKQPDDQP